MIRTQNTEIIGDDNQFTFTDGILEWITVAILY